MNMQIGQLEAAEGECSSLAFEQHIPLVVQRMVDCLFCILAAPFALALGCLISLLIMRDGGPVIYSQRRVGLHGREFSCLKFRSMVPGADARLEELLACDPAARAQWDRFQKLAKDPRITSFGRFIRATSLDELPQLINVWRGDMSIVGPRPILAEQIGLYGQDFTTYCAMRPGITGLWQISGRANRTFAERVRLDVQYAHSWSVLGDLMIMIRTVPVVLARRGAR
jgi:lipopolysaccharide/colanic/teichoic acid biosynthesis glycosyltransferase